MPRLNMIRPADANETALGWRFALRNSEAPTGFALSRQNLPILDPAAIPDDAIERGAYVLRDSEGGDPELILIGTGSEVSLCLEAADMLDGIRVRVVSMPCMDTFTHADEAYREQVLPAACTARIAVEAASPFGWDKWIGAGGPVRGHGDVRRVRAGQGRLRALRDHRRPRGRDRAGARIRMSTLVESQLADENPLVEGLERLPVHPTALVIFGATGDLAHRKLLPALYNLAHEGALPERFELIGVARREKPDDEFREMAKESIERYSRHRPDPAVLEGLLRDMRYVSGTFDEDKVYDEIDRILCDFDERAGLQHNRIYYLSTAPEFFPIIAGKIGGQRMDACEQADVRLVIEKPFGYDLESARMLNSQLLDVFDESQIYRIDHYLGKETVQNLMALRFANALFEPVWNRNYIDSVEITAAEDIGIGTRAGYYEGAGALRDLVQNHMMQLLSLLAMEPPAAFEANRLRDEKLKVLEAIVPPEIDKVASMAVRGSVRRG